LRLFKLGGVELFLAFFNACLEGVDIVITLGFGRGEFLLGLGESSLELGDLFLDALGGSATGSFSLRLGYGSGDRVA
jgi:hypothetical protein